MDCAVRKYLLAWLDDDEDMLEELPHHLLDRVDDADMEAVQGKFKHAAVVDQNEG